MRVTTGKSAFGVCQNSQSVRASDQNKRVERWKRTKCSIKLGRVYSSDKLQVENLWSGHICGWFNRSVIVRMFQCCASSFVRVCCHFETFLAFPTACCSPGQSRAALNNCYEKQETFSKPMMINTLHASYAVDTIDILELPASYCISSNCSLAPSALWRTVKTVIVMKGHSSAGAT